MESRRVRFDNDRVHLAVSAGNRSLSDRHSYSFFFTGSRSHIRYRKLKKNNVKRGTIKTKQKTKCTRIKGLFIDLNVVKFFVYIINNNIDV